MEATWKFVILRLTEHFYHSGTVKSLSAGRWHVQQGTSSEDSSEVTLYQQFLREHVNMCVLRF